MSLHAPTVGISARLCHENVRFSPQRIAIHRSFSFRYEGRSWSTSHRGRRWIDATAKEPKPATIAELETFSLSRADAMDEGQLDFPGVSPISVLLGCIDVIDCLDRETSLEQYPRGESASDYVLICKNPEEFFFEMPTRGHQQICPCHFFSSHVLIVLRDKMEPHAHQAAKKILFRRKSTSSRLTVRSSTLSNKRYLIEINVLQRHRIKSKSFG